MRMMNSLLTWMKRKSIKIDKNSEKGNIFSSDFSVENYKEMECVHKRRANGMSGLDAMAFWDKIVIFMGRTVL